MIVTVDPASPIPPFEQIRSQLAHQISSGQLVVGTKLPTVRRLAADLGVAVNTVLRAYQQLTAAALINTNGRAGTTVCANPDTADAELLQAAEAFAAVAHRTGTARTKAIRIVTTALSPASP